MLFFASDFVVCVAQSQRTIEDQGLIIEVKKYLQCSVTGKILLHMGRIQAKRGNYDWLLASTIYFKLQVGKIGLGVRGIATGKFDAKLLPT